MLGRSGGLYHITSADVVRPLFCTEHDGVYIADNAYYWDVTKKHEEYKCQGYEKILVHGLLRA